VTSSPTLRAAVLGAGSWGTAFGKVLADAGCDVRLWARRAEIAKGIEESRENVDYLPGIRLPDLLHTSGDAKEAIDGADLVVLAVPSQTLRENLTGWVEVIVEVAGVEPGRVAVVSGPNLAKEIALEQPAATVVACRDHARAELLQRASSTRYLRPYTNADVIGCELGGAVKNVIALACGMSEGMGFGDNTKASLITRGLAETTRLGVALGADPMTFSGLAGLGDLVATCTSPLSRNRTFGERLGRGETMEEAVAATRQTAEGVKSCRSILDLAHAHGVDMPLTEQVVRVCHEDTPPSVAVVQLMKRETKPELAR
jgi:glycerol-3-phosphate dehydrogenase (NAD(P)+)